MDDEIIRKVRKIAMSVSGLSGLSELDILHRSRKYFVLKKHHTTAAEEKLCEGIRGAT